MAEGSVIIRFPKSWSGIINSDLSINASAVTCTQIVSSVTSTATCALSTNGSDYYITFTSPFSTSMNSSFAFTVNPVLSIPISYSSTEVRVTTQDSIGNTIDQVTNCATVSPSANSFTLTTPTTTLVSRSFAPILSFRASDLINSNDTVRLTLPSDISFMNASLTMTINDSGSVTSRNLIYDSTNSNTTSYSYAIGSFSISTRSYANSNATVNFTNILLFSPPTTKPSGSIIIGLYRNSSIYSSGTLSITALSNTLTSASLTAATYTVNRQTTYTLSFTTASILSSTGSVTIQIPTTVTATDYAAKTCVVSGSTNISSSGTCAMSSRVLTVSNAFTGNVPASTTFSVAFDGVANP